MLANIIQFLAMGGYAVYVWPAFFIVFVILMVNVVIPIYHRRQLLNKIARHLTKG